MNILIIAGEVSGDLYASHLAKELKQNSTTTIYAIGGDQLKKQADTFIFSSTHNHAVGIESRFTKTHFRTALLNSIRSLLNQTQIHKVVIVDFQHYNEKIASLIAKTIPIYTFITPNFWMWKSTRQAKKVIAYSTKIFTIFEKEFSFYKSLSNQVFYFGHPLTEILDTTSLTQATNPIQITLLPGSRPQEFKLYFSTMLQSIMKLQENKVNFKLVICVSSKRYLPTIQNYLNTFPSLNYELSEENTTNEIKKSTLVIAASGSTTLEVVLLNKPLIVLAALPKLSYFLAKYILRIKLPFISLPNFIANQHIVTELVQSKITPTNLLNHINITLKTPQKTTKNYNKVISKLKKSNEIFKNISLELLK